MGSLLKQLVLLSNKIDKKELEAENERLKAERDELVMLVNELRKGRKYYGKTKKHMDELMEKYQIGEGDTHA